MAQYCTFHVADLYFGVEVEQVQEVLRYQHMTRVPRANRVTRGLINLRGEIVTAIDLRRRLGLDDRDGAQEPMNVVVRTREGSAVSLLVDQIGDVLEVPEELFEAPLATMNGVTRSLVQSICKLEDRLLLILDTFEAVELTSGVDTPGSER